MLMVCSEETICETESRDRKVAIDFTVLRPQADCTESTPRNRSAFDH